MSKLTLRKVVVSLLLFSTFFVMTMKTVCKKNGPDEMQQMWEIADAYVCKEPLDTTYSYYTLYVEDGKATISNNKFGKIVINNDGKDIIAVQKEQDFERLAIAIFVSLCATFVIAAIIV